MKRFLFLSLSLIFLSIVSFGQTSDSVNFKDYFGDFVGGISIYDIKSNKYTKYNLEHCKIRFSPASTYKIPNSLIGLETGVIADTGFVIKYDSLLHPKDSFKLANEPFIHWYEDLSLKRAFKYSCVWYYQELARRVGQEQMNNMVSRLDYGNKDITSGLDSYWLCGSIEISIDEQIEFLKKLYLHRLSGFSEENQEAVKSIMLYETTPDYNLYGKTGSGDCWDDKVLGWYVGFIETESGPKVFAMNVLVNEFKDLQNNYRIKLTKQLFKELKIIL